MENLKLVEAERQQCTQLIAAERENIKRLLVEFDQRRSSSFERREQTALLTQVQQLKTELARVAALYQRSQSRTHMAEQQLQATRQEYDRQLAALTHELARKDSLLQNCPDVSEYELKMESLESRISHYERQIDFLESGHQNCPDVTEYEKKMTLIKNEFLQSNAELARLKTEYERMEKTNALIKEKLQIAKDNELTTKEMLRACERDLQAVNMDYDRDARLLAQCQKEREARNLAPPPPPAVPRLGGRIHWFPPRVVVGRHCRRHRHGHGHGHDHDRGGGLRQSLTS